MDTIEEYRGDLWEWDLVVTVQDEALGADAPFDLAGVTLYATVKRRVEDEDADAVLAAETTQHTDAAGGLSAIVFPPQETAAVAPGLYEADVRLAPGPYVLWKGRVSVKEPVTRRVS